jgi:uncharacterized membrane protein
MCRAHCADLENDDPRVRVHEAQVQVVDEPGPPVGRADPRVQLRGERDAVMFGRRAEALLPKVRDWETNSASDLLGAGSLVWGARCCAAAVRSSISCTVAQSPPSTSIDTSTIENARSQRTRSGMSAGTLYPARMIPWIIMAVVVVPLVVIAFMAMHRKTAASELLADDDAQARAEQEFAEAEAYEARWREEDTERSRQELFP